MIFTSLGLLLVALGLLVAGIAKSSVALLMASLACTVVAGIVLTTVLPAARRLTAAAGAPMHMVNGQPVVLYVQQASTPTPTPTPTPTTTAMPTPDVTAPQPAIDLTAPIVGYDSMTAVQIAKLISSGALTDDQLDAVREYESATAGRKTVLAKLLLRRVALAVALCLAATACGADDDAAPATSTTAAASSWEDVVAGAFGPLTRSALELPDMTRRWLAGEVDADAFGAAAVDVVDAASSTRQLLEDAPERPGRALYLASADLYVAHGRTLLAGASMPAGPERDQVVLLARRLRELADRIFDRGHVLVDPDFGTDSDLADLNLPEEVPDWVAEGMAVGPPYEAAPPPPAATPPLRAEYRPTQPEAAWRAAVDAAGAPARVDLDGDVAAQARAYVAAAEALRDEPDPDVDGGRELSAVLRLSWLVKADAARAAQMALREVARAIDAVDVG